jgi:hypothetical protein
MPKPNQLKEHDQEVPRTRRAIIYLSEVCRPGTDESQFELPIGRQRMLCRHTATALKLEVVAEFVDLWFHTPRSELHRALELAERERVDYLMVSSRDRLEGIQDQTFEVAWRLGHAGTVTVLADGDDFPWESVTTPSRA